MRYRRYLMSIGLVFTMLMYHINIVAQENDAEDIIVYIKADNPDKVIKWLGQRDGVIPVGPQGDPLLVRAMREDARRVVELLLASPRVDVNQVSPLGESALMLAAYKGQRLWIERLLARDAIVQQEGWTALHYACAEGHLDIVEQLVERGAQVDSRSPNGTTPMMMAARGGHVAVVRWLLAHDARVYLHNEHELNAADFARDGGHKALEKALRDRIARARDAGGAR